MKLSTLHAHLAELIADGWGEHHVIDDRGNDVRSVAKPSMRRFSRSENSAVMLSLSIDHEGWNQ